MFDSSTEHLDLVTGRAGWSPFPDGGPDLLIEAPLAPEPGHLRRSAAAPRARDPGGPAGLRAGAVQVR